MKSAARSIINPLLHISIIETTASNLLSRFSTPVQIEERVSWGSDYPDKTFYVVRRPNYWGLMSIYVMYLRYFDYALRRGWIPVVDMQTTPNLYLDESESNQHNAWEYFFEQPCGYCLDDISHAKNVVLSSRHLLLAEDYTIDWTCLEGEHALRKWRGLARHYLRYSQNAKRYIAEAENEVFPSNGQRDHILGVYCRGTDYTALKPKGHAVQPTPEMAIEKAQDVMKGHGYSYIYLVTEDEDVLKLFIQAFGERLLFLNAQRYKASDNFIWQKDEMLNRSRVQNGLEYLASMFLLTKCDGFIGGVTGGTAALMLMLQKPYDYQYLWNLGRYD